MRLFLAVLVVLLLAFTASATPITLWVGFEDLALPGGDKDYNDLIFSMSSVNLMINGSGAWQPMSVPNQDGTPYWDNSSYDGAGGWNVGYFVLGTGNFAGNPNSPALPVSQTLYWGVGTNPDPSVLFFSTGGVNAVVSAEISAYSGSNSLYWFPASNPSASNLIFSGADGVGTMSSFNPGGDFGLRLMSPGGNYLTTVDGDQAAIFNEVPEPATFLIVGLGLIGLGFLRRKVARE